MTKIMTTNNDHQNTYNPVRHVSPPPLPRSLKSRHTLDEGVAKDVILRPGGPIARTGYDRLSPGTTLRRFVLRALLEQIFRQGSGRPHLRKPVNDHVPELREGPALGDDLLVGQDPHSQFLPAGLGLLEEGGYTVGSAFPDLNLVVDGLAPQGSVLHDL